MRGATGIVGEETASNKSVTVRVSWIYADQDSERSVCRSSLHLETQRVTCWLITLYVIIIADKRKHRVNFTCEVIDLTHFIFLPERKELKHWWIAACCRIQILLVDMFTTFRVEKEGSGYSSLDRRSWGNRWDAASRKTGRPRSCLVTLLAFSFRCPRQSMWWSGT